MGTQIDVTKLIYNKQLDTVLLTNSWTKITVIDFAIDELSYSHPLPKKLKKKFVIKTKSCRIHVFKVFRQIIRFKDYH